MATSISHTIEISGSPAEVWEVLTDTAEFPGWNPFITRLSGDLEKGTRLEVTIEPPGRRPMTFRPTVLENREGETLRWRGRVLIPGVFDGEHSFELQGLPTGGTRLTQAERFSGFLVPLARSVLAPTRQGFEEMNRALKARVERKAQARR